LSQSQAQSWENSDPKALGDDRSASRNCPFRPIFQPLPETATWSVIPSGKIHGSVEYAQLQAEPKFRSKTSALPLDVTADPAEVNTVVDPV
jgi:hypothetical protein